MPILLLVEVTLKLLGSGTLAALVPNRVAYGLLIFVPIWLVTYGALRKVNRRLAPSERIDHMMSHTSAAYRRACVFLYFAIPVVIFVVVLF